MICDSCMHKSYCKLRKQLTFAHGERGVYCPLRVIHNKKRFLAKEKKYLRRLRELEVTNR